MSRPKRPRVSWRSQRELVKAWLRSEGAPLAYGYTRTWGQATLSFEGAIVFTHDNWRTGSPLSPLAKLVKVEGRTVVCVQQDDVRSRQTQALNQRRTVLKYRAGVGEWGEVRVWVGDLAQVEAQQAWHSARVMRALGRWKRARENKHWRMMQLDDCVKERALYERAFGLARTVEEAEVRTARVVSALTR